MNSIAAVINVAERLPMPDIALRFGVNHLVDCTSRRLAEVRGVSDRNFAFDMDGWPIAVHTEAANDQHYEIPPDFFRLVLGPRRKYSSCLYPSATTSLAEAEIFALKETCAHGGLTDGQSVLELGCGWGSLSLFMAKQFPTSQIVSVSNSSPQRRHIEAEAARLGLTNLTVITADMNVFDTSQSFDRIVTVEMFEHMSNWRQLLAKANGWVKPDGRMFMHVFSHRTSAYRFDHDDKADWIAQHFFTGGVMPSHELIRQFDDSFTLEQDWRWNGKHYQRTALDWLKNFDVNRDAIRRIFDGVYGVDAAIWMRRWRLFFLATAGLFGHGTGDEWAVSHYLLRATGRG